MSAALPSEPGRTAFALRALRAARLHADTFEEVEADRRSFTQALLLVALCSASAAIGASSVRGALIDAAPAITLPYALHIAVAAVEPFVLWLVTGAFAYMVGATFLRGPDTQTDYREVLRTTGFAFGPGVLLALAALIPVASGAVAMTVFVRLWILAAWTVAVRQALDYTTVRALGTAVVAFVLAWLLLWGLAVSI